MSSKAFIKLYNMLMPSENDPGMEGMMMGKEKADESPAAQKTDEPMEYVIEEQAMGRANVEKRLNKQPESMGMCAYVVLFLMVLVDFNIYHRHNIDITKDK